MPSPAVFLTIKLVFLFGAMIPLSWYQAKQFYDPADPRKIPVPAVNKS